MRYAWLVLIAAAAAADDVILVSGGEITNCRVVYEGPDEVIVDRGGTQMVFPRSQVLRIVRGEVEEPAPAPAPAVPAPAPAAPAPAPGKAPPAEEAAPSAESGDVQRIKRLIDSLASENERTRQAARFSLLAFGKKACPELAPALTDGRYWVRLYAARILISLRPREATKAMLEALYAALPERGVPPAWNRPYINAVRDALRATTGQSFGLNPRDLKLARALKRWLEWWEKNYGRFPPQVGEKELDNKSTTYKADLKEARRLVLRKKSYRKPRTWSEGY